MSRLPGLHHGQLKAFVMIIHATGRLLRQNISIQPMSLENHSAWTFTTPQERHSPTVGPSSGKWKVKIRLEGWGLGDANTQG